MIKTGFDFIHYLPKDTIYKIVSTFKHIELGNIIGYVSKEGDIYFRLETDLEKFNFTNGDYFDYTAPLEPTYVKFKLSGEWKDYMWSGRKIIPMEQFLDDESTSLEKQLNHLYRQFENKYDYYYMIEVEDENQMWSHAKQNKFDKFEFKQQKNIFLKDKISLLKEKL